MCLGQPISSAGVVKPPPESEHHHHHHGALLAASTMADLFGQEALSPCRFMPPIEIAAFVHLVESSARLPVTQSSSPTQEVVSLPCLADPFVSVPRSRSCPEPSCFDFQMIGRGALVECFEAEW